MLVLSRLGRMFWIGLLFVILAAVVWFLAPGAQSCVSDFDTTVCETGGVVLLNVLALVLFSAGGGLMFVAVGLAHRRAREQQSTTGEGTR